MSDAADFSAPFPQDDDDAGISWSQTADQADLLRAALADARARVAELEELADTDALTPLANRRRFLRDLERTVALADRHGEPAALLWIELDGLKPLDRRHGYTAGDAALIHVARLLAGLVRATDQVARVGGDQFAVILDHLDHNSAIETADRIGRCIAEHPLDLGGRHVPLSATIGIATVLPGDSVDDVLGRAHRNVQLAREES